MNSIYAPIISILREGPSTSLEITDKYNIINKTDKKENTIYKYLNELKKAGLIIESGAQIYLTKSYTKTLYQLSHKYFVPDNDKYNVFNSDIGNLLAEIVGVFLSRHFDKKFPESKEFKEFLAKFSKKSYDKFYNFMVNLKDLNVNKAYENAWQSLNNSPAKACINTMFHLKFIIELLENNTDEILSIKELFVQEESVSFKDLPETIDTIDGKNIVKNKDFDQKMVQSVNSENWKKYFEPIVYAAIIYLLRKKSMTVQEIFSKLYETMLEIYKEHCDIYEDFAKEEIPDKPTEIKSEATVYKYVKELVNAGYLAEEGRIYTAETKSSQILYARSSKLYIMYSHETNMFDDEEGNKLLENIGNYLALYLGYAHYDVIKLKEAIINLYSAVNSSLEKAYSELANNSVIDVARRLKGEEFDTTLDCISQFEFFLHSEEMHSEELRANVRNCFF